MLLLRRITRLLGKAFRWGFVPLLRHWLGRPEPPERLGARLRRFSEDMGVSFIKVAQYLSIRLDLLPKPICDELAHLFDDVPGMPFARALEQLEAELGGSWRQHFHLIEPTPVASASIAQVHRAVARDFEVVAVKIQRTGVAEILESDLRILRGCARLADALRLLGEISLRQVVDEIADFTRRELDFVAEGRTAEHLRAQVPPGIHVPRIRWDLSGRRVLTMQFVEGITLAELCRAADAGDPARVAALVGERDLNDIVRRLADACFRQIFVTGLFHGDPHPANIIIEPDGHIAFVDFGVFAELEPDVRRRFAAYVEWVARGRLGDAFASLTGLVRPGEATDLAGYRRDALDIMRRWFSASFDSRAPVGSRLVARYQTDMLGAMRRHRIRMPPNQLLFWRALAVVDSTAHRLPVDFDLLVALRAFFARADANRDDWLRQPAGSPPGGLMASVLMIERAELAYGGLRISTEEPRPGGRADREAKSLVLLLLGTGLLVQVATTGLVGSGWLPACGLGLVLVGVIMRLAR